MSSNELDRARDNCLNNEDKSACEALINNGLHSVEQCDKDTCRTAGAAYYNAERYTEAIPYYEKAIALEDNKGYVGLGAAYYYGLQDYPNAKKYFEMGCNKGNGDYAQAESCYNLGLMYYNGNGVHKDYAKVAELWKKACDMQEATACNNLGALYYDGKGVSQDIAKAVELFKKACDMQEANACFNLMLYLYGQGVK